MPSAERIGPATTPTSPTAVIAAPRTHNRDRRAGLSFPATSSGSSSRGM